MFRETGARCVRGWEHSVMLLLAQQAGRAEMRNLELDTCV
jgi:hypothetical protein